MVKLPRKTEENPALAKRREDVEDAALRNTIEDGLWKRVGAEFDSDGRQRYKAMLVENEFRYQAIRSIPGWRLTGSMDPRTSPLDEPWDDASDIPWALEKVTIQALMPHIDESQFDISPITDTKIFTDQGIEDAGILDEFIEYMAIDRANLPVIRRKTSEASYKFSEGVERVLVDVEERRIKEIRHFLIKGNEPKTEKKLVDARTDEPVEVLDPEDITVSMMGFIRAGGADPRSKSFLAFDQLNKSTNRSYTDEQALEVAGIKVNQSKKTVTFAQLIGNENAPQGRPYSADWNDTTVYRVEPREVTPKITISQGFGFKHVLNKNWLFPSDEESDNIMDWDWCGEQYDVSIGWIWDNRDLFYDDMVKKAIEVFKDGVQTAPDPDKGQEGPERERDTPSEERGESRQFPRICEIWGRVVLNEDDDTKDDYLQEVEGTFWFIRNLEGDRNLLGYRPNPYARYPEKHIRPYFNFQVRPLEGRRRGDNVCESLKAIRDAIDWSYNDRQNRQRIDTNPPLLATPKAFYKGQLDRGLLHYPGVVWLMSDETMTMDARQVVTYLHRNTSEQISLTDERSLLAAMRLYWGATEALSGVSPKTESDTATEYVDLQRQSARQFGATVKSFLHTQNLQWRFIAQLIQHSREIDQVEFLSKQDNTLQIYTRQLLVGKRIIIRARSKRTELERTAEASGLMDLVNFLTEMGAPEVEVDEFRRDLIKRFQELRNIENIKLPSADAINDSRQAKYSSELKQLAQESLQKIVMAMSNDGSAKIVEQALDASGVSQMLGLDAPGGPKWRVGERQKAQRTARFRTT